MGFLVCEKCGGYYKLQDGESPDDFEQCHCGGRLKYYRYISDYIRTENILEGAKDHKTLVHDKEGVMEELELYNGLKDQSNPSNSKIEYINPEKYLKNNAVIILIFSISLFAYGIAYECLYLDIMGICAIVFALGLYLTSTNVIQNKFIKNIYLLGSVFFIIVGLVVTLFTFNNFYKLLMDSRYKGGNCSVITIMALISFYLGIIYFSSYNNPEKQFDPMKNTKESMFLGMFRRNLFSLFNLILIVVFCSSIVFISKMHFF